MSPCRLLLIPGSLRARSTTTAVLRTAGLVAPADVVTALYQRLGSLPHFNPDEDRGQPPAEAADLRRQIRQADGLLFSVSEYAGGLPGSFKNLLDWTIGDDQPGSIYEKPVAWINASPRGAVHALDSLRTVLGYAHADIVEPACVDVPIIDALIGADGLIGDAPARARIAQAVSRLAEWSCKRG